MGDSDDEYDRRRARDKFRRERSEAIPQRRGEDRGRRDDYVESRREMWTRDRNRREYREVDLRRRERYSPPRHDISPPMKKMRRDWDDHGYGGNYEMGYGGGNALLGSHHSWGNTGAPDIGANVHAQHGGYGGHSSGGGHNIREMDGCPSQPPMMTFKQFLASQDDAISDEEAVRKYNDYKQEFRRQQLNDFFLTHKEEEWFKSKYQPEECLKRRQEQLTALHKRVDVFFELLEKSWIDSVSVDAVKGDDIIRLLDAVVIKLEGGSDADLKVLDESPVDDEKRDVKSRLVPSLTGTKEEAKVKTEEIEITDPSNSSEAAEVNKTGKSKKNAKSDHKDGEDVDGDEERNDNDDNVENSSGSGKGGDEDSGRPDSAASSTNDVDAKTEDGDGHLETEIKKQKKKKSDNEEGEDEKDGEDAKSEEGSLPEADGVENEADVSAHKRVVPTSQKETLSPPRALHKTCSIFLRNLAPTITKQEVEAMCRRFPGFLRVAIADPQPERRFFRRGWVTFERGVNIKEICWNLNNIRLRDCELGAIVNRDLTRRIRSCNGITSHKQVCRADIKLAAKIIQNLDKRHDLFTEDKSSEEQEEMSFGLISRNPLLKNITDYLIEEADAEEEELLGKSITEETKKDGEVGETTIERDEALIKVVDRLLLYLRIVHSVDYYNHSDYPNEDEMPNRCGIMHARGSAPSTKVTQSDINDYIANFELKMAVFLQPVSKLLDEESLKLGRKDPAAEVEKFILANAQELGKDKWLCPLSGKKFKGPEYVRKHIFNKHSEKVDEVKKEVEYFNNYLMDSKRPQLSEHPGNRPRGGSEGGGREPYGPPGGGGGGGYPPPPPYGMGYGQGSRMPLGHGPNLYAGYGGRGGGGNYGGDNYRIAGGSGFYPSKRGGTSGGRNRGDPREIIGYHDLDAPDDLDLF